MNDKYERYVPTGRMNEIELLFEMSLSYGDMDVIIRGWDGITSEELIRLVEVEPDYFKRQKLVKEISRSRPNTIVGMKRDVEKKAKEFMGKYPRLSEPDFASFIYEELFNAWNRRMDAITDGVAPPTEYFCQTIQQAYSTAYKRAIRSHQGYYGGTTYSKRTKLNYTALGVGRDEESGHMVEVESDKIFDDSNDIVERVDAEQLVERLKILANLNPTDIAVMDAIVNDEIINALTIAKRLNVSRGVVRASLNRMKKVFGELLGKSE